MQYFKYNYVRNVLKEENQLPQTDRASAFVVDRLNICLTSSLITIHNLVVVSHTVCTHVGGPKDLEEAAWAPPIRTWARLTAINTVFPHICYLPNFVAVGQIVWS